MANYFLGIQNGGRALSTSRRSHKLCIADSSKQGTQGQSPTALVKLPEKWESVKLLYVKTERSVALPIFSSFVSSWDEAKGVNISSLKKQEVKKISKQKEQKKRRKEKKRNRKPMKQGRKSTSALPTEEMASKTCGSPVKGPGPQKKETPKPEKKETCRIKTENKVQVESEEEIPLLVPIGKTPVKENVEVPKHATGEKSPVKSPGSNPPRGKKRKAFPASEMPKAPEPKTPGKGPGKKPRVKEKVEKQRNSPLGKKDPRQMPKEPEAKFFTTANKSARKASHTPKQWPPKPKVPQLT
ncbi:ribosomal L1 domain-containing protein 1-like [Myotis daubentonii]|uniref:ribosomal L1 domain-containing protein 1-like n=1 Tax=Myotis daubentonii TaxID=98922 RepID=UPI002873838A|nr:ribosomal L1 domain-containing protein 1-like [Myotis daubentonii]